MNRLVIIGNGFDLAHGLPTGYCDFIDWYWSRVIENISKQQLNSATYSDKFINIQFAFKSSSFSIATHDFKKIIDYSTMIDFVKKYTEAHNLMFAEQFDRCKLGFSNSFFNIICDRKTIKNWVDIENEYYTLLKECLSEEGNSKVTRLNQEFEQVKNLLEEYLITQINEKFDFDIANNKIEQILSFFQTKPLKLHLVDPKNNDYLKEFDRNDIEELIGFDAQITELDRQGLLADSLKAGKTSQTNLFLNFNYTKTVEAYLKLIETKKYFGTSYEIQIHGQLQNSDNKINFGFGDEMDDDYKLLEKKDDNEYLRNIKSFQYLQNSNYKDVLDFIESNKFQVYIMGHSCGLSDRILLNTIFEHNNCRSIKVFYYEKNGKNNYTDIVQNISRHFNKKKMMRDKIVNKSLCQPLPQTIRFAEKLQKNP